MRRSEFRQVDRKLIYGEILPDGNLQLHATQPNSSNTVLRLPRDKVGKIRRKPANKQREIIQDLNGILRIKLITGSAKL